MEHTRKQALQVTSSPHTAGPYYTTQLMMLEVALALVPAMVVAIWVFKWFAIYQVGLCILTCIVSEFVFTKMRGYETRLSDLSAVVTGLILGLSLPWSAPWQIAVVGSVIAIGVGKIAYGGLGFNIFNPAMVGRAFVMISFATAMGSGAYLATGPEVADSVGSIDVVSQATPLTQLKSADDFTPLWQGTMLTSAMTGMRNGSLGEISVLAILLGGIYLIIRRISSWRIPLGMLLAVFVCGALTAVTSPVAAVQCGTLYLINGAVMFGAFFIATDPVTSPMTPKGQWIFGIGVGVLTMVIRLFSGYPEGVMFAVLIMNALVPILNNTTVPKPFGSP